MYVSFLSLLCPPPKYPQCFFFYFLLLSLLNNLALLLVFPLFFIIRTPSVVSIFSFHRYLSINFSSFLFCSLLFLSFVLRRLSQTCELFSFCVECVRNSSGFFGICRKMSNAQEATLFEYFSFQMSPRNICVWAKCWHYSVVMKSRVYGKLIQTIVRWVVGE